MSTDKTELSVEPVVEPSTDETSESGETEMKTFTEKELNDMSITKICEHYNTMADKKLKKFSTKPEAIKRTLAIQKEKVPKKVNKPLNKVSKKTEPKKDNKPVKKVNRDKNVTIVSGEPKEGSTEYVMFQCIEDNMGSATIGEIITAVKKKYKRPSGQEMEDKLILRRLRKAVNNGHLEIEEK